jgi:hypothetical protein
MSYIVNGCPLAAKHLSRKRARSCKTVPFGEQTADVLSMMADIWPTRIVDEPFRAPSLEVGCILVVRGDLVVEGILCDEPSDDGAMLVEALSPRERHREHPLPQRDRRKHMLDEVRSRRAHLPAEARQAEAYDRFRAMGAIDAGARCARANRFRPPRSST